MQLSPHFSLAELTRTEVRVINVPGPAAKENLVRLCETVLEPMRELFVPRLQCQVGALLIGSGYRTPEVNHRLGGEAKSAHLDGRAADVQPANRRIFEADVMDALVASPIAFDRAIYERLGDKVWLHVQIGRTNCSDAQRLKLMRVSTGYQDWDPKHPKVLRA